VIFLVDSIELVNWANEDNRCACGVSWYPRFHLASSVVFFVYIHKPPESVKIRSHKRFSPNQLTSLEASLSCAALGVEWPRMDGACDNPQEQGITIAKFNKYLSVDPTRN
jgi:hypothetical protein